MLEVTDLSCTRNDQLLFEHLNFSLAPGEVVRIEGPNGSGKTSLLRIICALAVPDEGSVIWQGRPAVDIRSEYTGKLCYVGHSNGIKTELTPLENLEITQALFPTYSGSSPEDALLSFGLQNMADVPVQKLSSGQRRRVALSRLLVTNAQIWILDEPFTSLDKNSRLLVKKIIAQHLEAEGLAIMVTHEPIDLPEAKLKRIFLS